MAETCSGCGKTLTFRDKFEWQGKKVCKSCLRAYKSEAEPEVSKDEKKKKGKAEEISWEKMNKDIKGWGIALIVLGVIHLLASGYLDSAWGVVIIVLGIVNLLVRKKEMFIANGIALIVVGFMNIGSGFESSGRWAFFGILQLVWGGQEIYKYTKYKKLREMKSGIQEEEKPVTTTKVMSATIPKDFSQIKDYKTLFNLEKLGINFYLGAALIIGFTLSNFIWQISAALFDGGRIQSFITSHVIVVNVITAVVFLFVHYKFITNLRSLALINGGFFAVLDLINEIIAYQDLHKIDPNFPFHFERIFIGFIWGFLLVYILAETIKRGGLNLKQIIIGMIVLQFVGNIADAIIYVIFWHHWWSSNWYTVVIASILNGAMFGILIYYGFVLHLKKHMQLHQHI